MAISIKNFYILVFYSVLDVKKVTWDGMAVVPGVCMGVFWCFSDLLIRNADPVNEDMRKL